MTDFQVGPTCRDVEDATLMLAVIAGCDELDPASLDTPVPDYNRAFRMQTSKLRLGIRGPHSSRAWTRKSRMR